MAFNFVRRVTNRLHATSFTVIRSLSSSFRTRNNNNSTQFNSCCNNVQDNTLAGIFYPVVPSKLSSVHINYWIYEQHEKQSSSNGKQLNSHEKQLNSGGKQLKSGGKQLNSSGKQLNFNGKQLNSYGKQLNYNGKQLNLNASQLSFELPKKFRKINQTISLPNNLWWVPPLEEPSKKQEEKIIEAPGVSNAEEKQAARLIVIRRKKMKKHKLRKLRKKMKYEWAKKRQRRELKKEKTFQAGLIAQCKQAENFSAEEYVDEKLRQLNEQPLPNRWKGRRLPEFIIRQKLGLPPK